jgi:hypothetical protein
MNGMPLLLQVMAEMQTPGSVPQPLSAHDKKDLHGVSSHNICLW